MLRAHVMPPRNFGNRNPGIQCLADDPPLLLSGPAPAASHSGAYLHPPKRDLRVAYSVGHMCETFPPKREVCLVARTSIKVGSENRLRNIRDLQQLIEMCRVVDTRLAQLVHTGF